MELSGVWWEARRADKVAAQLFRLRCDLDLEFYDTISALLREVESASRLLRDLHDLFSIYRARIPIVLYYLTVILPCLCKTLRDMMIYIDNESLPPRTQWTLMCERMGDQGGMTLAARFVMYVEFIVRKSSRSISHPASKANKPELVRLLSRWGKHSTADWIILTDVSRSPLYDPTSLELLRMRVLRLRLLRNIPGMRF